MRNKDKKTKAIEDSGANVNIATTDLAQYAISIGYQVAPASYEDEINTADSGQKMQVLGWLWLGGYVGKLAVTNNASFNLLATTIHQKRGLGAKFCTNHEATCELYNEQGTIMTIEKDPINNLYYVDIFQLAEPPETKKEQNIYANAMLAQSRRKEKPSHDVSYRVWRLHIGMFHTSLRKICAMMRANTLLGIQNCTVQEIELVMAHQQCPACAIAKSRKRIVNPGSGMRSQSRGQAWSADYQGEYNPPAIGGYTGKITLTELTNGYGTVFLVKSKTELFPCIQKVALYCKTYGMLFTLLRCDYGKVEMSELLRKQCGEVNGPNIPGIEIREAGPEQQHQNPVERHQQSADNQVNTLMMAQTLLSAAWWGYANISVWKTRNSTSNSLCPDSTPLYLMENKVTDMTKSMLLGFGQAVVSTRLGHRKKSQHTPRNEFGVVVMPGNLLNGTVLVYLPEHGHFYVAPRYNVTPINLGENATLSAEDGQRLLPVLSADGTWHLKSRGDNNLLSKKYKQEINKQYDDAAHQKCRILTSDINSSIIGDQIIDQALIKADRNEADQIDE
jgi:hypothetical protein